MQPGYIIGMDGFQNLGLGTTPGILLGLNSQNTSGFSFQQLTPNGGLPSGCSTAGHGLPAELELAERVDLDHDRRPTYNLGTASLLPDSGICYMIVNSPGTPGPPPGRTPAPRAARPTA